MLVLGVYRPPGPILINLALSMGTPPERVHIVEFAKTVIPGEFVETT